jgi:hypothetical protein
MNVITVARGANIWHAPTTVYLIMHYGMKSFGGVQVKLCAFLTSSSDEEEWSASRSGRFFPEEL